MLNVLCDCCLIWLSLNFATLEKNLSFCTKLFSDQFETANCTFSFLIIPAELNGYGAETMSKRSMPIQPALVVPSVHPEGRESYSEYSQVQKRGGSNFNL